VTDEPIIIVDDTGTEHEFPAGFDPVRAAGIVRAASEGPPKSSGPKAGLALAATSHGLPGAATAAEEFVTNPNVPRVAAKIGRVVGGVAPVIGGGAAGGIPGAAMGVAAASKGAWAGGKTGWFSGKLAQDVATPMARGLARMAPYAKALGTASGVQSGLDLAQMAEPSRRDIGTMGVGASIPHDAEHPALINKGVTALRDLVRRKLGGGEKIKVTDPEGVEHEFDSQVQADHFRKLAGMS
jgi:hypothetical protein